MNSISIVIADAEHLVRRGMRDLFSEIEDFNILSETENEEELIEEVQKHQPQVVILDHNQPKHFRPETVKQVKTIAPKSNILIISNDEDKKVIYQILEAGVKSYLTKTCDEEEVLDAVRATAKGDKFFCSRVLDFLWEKSFAKESEDTVVSPLSNREVEIVKLVAKGLIAKEIASELNLSTHTVYTHRKNIMKKLKLGTSTELVLYAVNHGIV